jgi:hypothetical protein
LTLRLAGAVALLCTTTLAASGAAQNIPVRPDTVAADSARRLSPRSAFIRSVLVPGWGQASAGSYRRGGIWFAIHTTSWYMLGKTLGKLSEARDHERRRMAFATDSLELLIAEDTAAARRLGTRDSLAFQQAVDANGRVTSARSLIEARERHRQDWITYTLFFTMMSGVDAYVNAHLTDWPVELSAEPRRDGALVIQAKYRLGSVR